MTPALRCASAFDIAPDLVERQAFSRERGGGCGRGRVTQWLREGLGSQRDQGLDTDCYVTAGRPWGSF